MLCQCPKLTPLQSRFAASLAALVLIGFIYWSLSNPNFAYAAELDVDGSGQSRGGEDHNWHRTAQQRLEEDGVEGGEGVEGNGVERMVEARATAPLTIQGNDMGSVANIQPGDTTVWKYPQNLLTRPQADRGSGFPQDVQQEETEDASHKELRRRQDDGATIFISINTCLQPDYAGSGTQTGPPPQLTLYASTSSANTNPGPGASPGTQREIPLDEGYASTNLTASGDWYMSVSAPELPSEFRGVWNYELAVSNTGYYHAVANATGPELYFVDADMTTAMLVTGNLTQANSTQSSYQQWMSLTAPYIIFASNANHTPTLGLSNSFCALNKSSQLTANGDDVDGTTTNVQMRMITRGVGAKPKEQFYLAHLNSSSSYNATLAIAGNSTASGAGVVGGGGTVLQRVPFATKSDGNCALLYNLTFCDQVAYSVPSTPAAVANFTQFQNFWDNYTTTWYQNFNFSLQQIPCDTTTDAQYSLARTCADCAAAYKTWLCAVSIPRCADFSDSAPYLQARNMGQQFLNGSAVSSEALAAQYVPMPGAPNIEGTVKWQTYGAAIATNQSRNPMIDSVIAPGPYKEVLPCEDLCYTLVQSCPASMGFGCPYPGKGLEVGYGRRVPGVTGTCNSLDVGGNTSGAAGWSAQGWRAVVVGMGVVVVVLGL